MPLTLGLGFDLAATRAPHLSKNSFPDYTCSFASKNIFKAWSVLKFRQNSIAHCLKEQCILKTMLQISDGHGVSLCSPK